MASMFEEENMLAAKSTKSTKGTKKSKAPLGTVNGDDEEDEERTINGRAVEQVYVKKTQLEHILLRPDTYIGSIERSKQDMWVHDEERERIVRRSTSYVPGLYKIFDEIIVNAADNKQRDANMTKLKVTIDAQAGSISVWNNGQGIPITKHKEQKCYVPELIFGHLLTGSNFDDKQKKTTGGRNGYGAKLANIFSTEFIVETADAPSGKKYKQVFSNNMADKTEPEITSYSGSDFTCITFKPDWDRFTMDGLESDTEALLRKRVHDIAGCMSGYGGKKVKVYLNGKVIDVSNFKEYLDLYEGMEELAVHESVGGWDIAVGSSDGQFQQVSFVNAICTIKGGNHVNYIADQVVAHLTKVIKRKDKGSDVKPHHIKNHLNICVNALVENPAFESQSKESLNTKASAFGGSDVKLSDKTLKAIEKSSVVDAILSWCKFQASKGLSKKSGKKTSKLTGITKLDDANFAGTAKSQDCTLILTEGDSAKTLAVSGLGVVGRDYYGVFPLKGKLLNVRDSTIAQVSKNEEISNVVRILGLKFGEQYTDTRQLRYGHLMIMTDQDHDGSHIKGLLINFIHHFWPSLLRIDGFLLEFITPIVKCTKGQRELSFFTVPEYEQWREANNNGKGWVMKYYKGLGTSTAKEAKEYFAKIDTHQIPFDWEDDERDANLIEMAFDKKRQKDRKTWLKGFKPGTYVDYSVDSMTYESFINDEFILFSMEDNKRSLPSMIDGFKPSQRKVLFACFKRKLKAEIKVAQLAGYVSEHSAYHHGEVSLTGTIVNMAQTFCGSNNLALLTPGGQFGTRLMGGKDAASARYIFTKLERIARAVFHPDDDAVLTYLDDDGMSIEPAFFVPVLPMVLVNGVEGIGTGWSTSVLNYSPRDVLENLRRRIRQEPMVEMQPWFRGFVGTIKKKAGTTAAAKAGYTTEGIVERTGPETVEITELPIKRWTQDYKVMLESMFLGAEDPKAKGAKGAKAVKGKKPAKKTAKNADNADEDEDEEAGTGKGSKKQPAMYIKDFRENHTDTTVHFTVTMAAPDLDYLEEQPNGLRKFFKLESSITTSNMTMFDEAGTIAQYQSPLQVLSEFYEVRLRYYGLRKAHLLSKLQREWSRLDNKVRFVLAVVGGTLEVRNRKKSELLQQLHSDGFDPLLPETGANGRAKVKPVAASSASEDESGSSSESEDSTGDSAGLAKGYDYLLGMKLWTLTREMVAKLEAELEVKTRELKALKDTTLEQLWLRDLDAVSEALDECDAAHAQNAKEESKQRRAAARGGSGGGGKRKGTSKKRAAADESDDSDFEGAGKKRSKKARNGPPLGCVAPPTPAAHARTAETLLADGTRVSTVFAEALQAGRYGKVSVRKEAGCDIDDSMLVDDDGDDEQQQQQHDPAVAALDYADAADSDCEAASSLAAAKGAAAKAKSSAKVAVAAAAAAVKKAKAPRKVKPVAEPEQEEQEEDEVVGDLQSRLKAKYLAAGAAAAAAKAHSDDDDMFDYPEGSDDAQSPLPGAKAAAKKTAAAAAKAKPAAKPAAVKRAAAATAAAKKAAVDSDDSGSDDDVQEVRAPAASVKAAVPRRAAAAAASKKVAETVLNSGEEEGSDSSGSECDSGDEDSDESAFENAAPKKGSKKAVATTAATTAAASKKKQPAAAAAAPKAAAKPKAKAAPVKRVKKHAAHSDADDDSDIEVVAAPKAMASKSKAASTSAAAAKPRKLLKKPAAAADSASDGDDESESDAPPKAAEKAPAKKRPAAAAPAAKPAAAKKPRKAAAAAYDSDADDSGDESGVEVMDVQPRARPGRARAAVSYVNNDEDEESSAASESDSDA